VIAATNKILSRLVDQGAFREDLFYRLNVVRLSLPPLSRRREDIPYLLEHFIERFNAIKGKDIVGVSDEALEILMRYDFPGNVRELENFIEYAFILCHGSVIEAGHLPGELIEKESPKEENGIRPPSGPLESAEIGTLMEALREHGGNRRKTAAHLGINKTTLWRKMKKYGLSYPP
ncbi:MAG TPA: sigma-54-dependent Fis family transcriptional regulator, partial [Deltaproteobacteria bacterium]|nr:sigma-54-dependent Fis family transcriptional regulator [Deltaproteobacteria bacterium]